MMRRESIKTKIRNLSTPSISRSPSDQRLRNLSLLGRPPTPTIVNKLYTISEISELSEKQRTKEYDNYQTTGDFQKDFIYLSHLIGVTLPIRQRAKLPLVEEPAIPTDLQSSGGKKLAKDGNTPVIRDQLNKKDRKALKEQSSQETTGISETEKPSPRTFIVCRNTHDYFKPHVEVDTMTESNNEYITELYLRGRKVDMQLINILSKTLPQLERLTVLNMTNAGLVDESLYCLGQCLALLPSLKTLHLDGNDFVVNQRFDVFLNQQNQIRLQNLSLRNCNLTETGGLLLANSLVGNKSLLTLNLCFNKLGDVGAGHLASSLRLNRTLLSLNIANNRIGDEGVKHIAEALSTFPLTDEQLVTRIRLHRQLRQRMPSPDAIHSVSRSHSARQSTKKKDGPPGKGKDKRGKSNAGKAKLQRQFPKADTLNDLEQTRITDIDEDPYEFKNPFLEEVLVTDGLSWISGNRSLINLNLSRNKISANGVEFLYLAVKYQEDLARESNKTAGVGLLRMSLQKNLFSLDHLAYVRLLEIFKARDPLDKTVDTTSEENN